ncbi:ABC transporter permease [uncultured Draconibacterium sp.]|uniref:ABC transporter permease n=1 Tax=uncultured Draconibacterium sp. TaxID=1573823 RepID=UPI00326022C4
MSMLNSINQKIIFRNLLRNKLHSSINIMGFAVGIAVFMMIVRYVNHQFSYDRFHQQQESIYKIHLGDSKSLPPAIAPFVCDNISAIENFVRIDEWYAGGSLGYLKSNNETFRTSDLLFVDDSFFDFFDFELLYGDAESALSSPNSIILSESLATTIFGNENPTGKQIEYLSDFPSATYNFTVAGVMANAPTNSSIQYNGLISMSTIQYHKIRNGNINEDWGNWGFATYVKIASPKVAEQINSLTPEFWDNFVSERWQADKNSPRAERYKLNMVPLKEVHFASGQKRSSVYLIFFIGLVILLIAIFNYINLSLAISTTRIKEIGIRKVIGSAKNALFVQFIKESIMITFIAAVLAGVLILLLHPYLKDFTGFDTIIAPEHFIQTLLFFIAGVMVIGLLSGLYPAWFLTKIAPIRSLKNEINRGKKGNKIKQVLLVSQFVVSIILLVVVISISKQVNFIRNKELGFDKDHIIYLSGSSNIDKSYDTFRETLLQNPEIQNVARSNGRFVAGLNLGLKHKVNGEYKTFRGTTIDPDFVETFGLEIIEGRNFRKGENDLYNTALVNEQFVKKMELESPIGSVVSSLKNDVTIIGVVKDFHIYSLRTAIDACMLCYYPWNSCVNIKISGHDIENSIAIVEKTWNELVPGVPFEYHFLDDDFEKLYKTETEFSSIIKLFTALAVFIASLGLFGLISFSAVQRRKEIGIRKINGANIYEILTKLNAEVLLWVAIAFVIACPIAYYAMDKWLENFAYKTNLSWWIFALAGVLALGIALLTVSWQSWRAATRNPVEALRYE